MTWVIGRAGPFGHATGLSDIRIRLKDGTERDCLQKIYKVGPQLVLGFAGSVAIGLEIVAQLGVALQPPEDGSWHPHYIAEGLPVGTRQLFSSFPANERELGCQLMLLSAHPTENDGAAPWARCYVHRFYAPNFEPIAAAQAEIVSIGSGASVESYKDALETFSQDMDMFKLEKGFSGGSGVGLMSSLTSLLMRVPTAGISRHLHICLVGRESVRLGTNDAFTSHGDATNEPMPDVAKSLDDLKQILVDTPASMLELATC